MDSQSEGAPTILVVDDFDDFRLLMTLQLKSLGYHVVEAADGEQAVATAHAEHPALILMDIGMPLRSGISAVYRIRKDPALRDIPIVAITAYATPDLRQDALKAGCTEYLTKPVDSAQVEELVTRLLPIKGLFG